MLRRGYRAIQISTIVDIANYKLLANGYRAIQISTIVDYPLAWCQPKGYRAIQISTIVDLKILIHLAWAIEPFKFLLL